MNISEAHATQRVLDALMGRPVDLSGAALAALELNGRARKALGAGRDAQMSTIRANLALIASGHAAAGARVSPSEAYGRLVAALQEDGADAATLARVAQAAGRLSGALPH